MLELADALDSAAGRRFLSQQGVMTDPAEFIGQLRPPPRQGFVEATGATSSSTALVVYSGQQIYPDYAESVLAKIRALDRLAEHDDIEPVLLWSDTDRSGSDKAITTIRWPMPDKVASVSLAARSTRPMEIRFVEADPERMRESWQLLGAWLAQTVNEPRERGDALARHAALGAKLEGAGTLAEANHALTDVLMNEALGLSIPSVFVSTLATGGLITASLERLLTYIDDFVEAYNDGIKRLASLGFNSHLQPRDHDYLPLYYSCPEHKQRVRLVHVRKGAESFATASCSYHGSHRFSLGRGERSLAELEATGRWSPDVTLPIHLTDLVSGVVAGRSSALYGIVLGWAQHDALGIPPCPILVPQDLGRPPPEGSVHSLLFSYLTGVVP